MEFLNYSENVPPMPNSNWKSDSTFTYSILSNVYKVANKNVDAIFPHYNDLKSCKINEKDLLDLSYCDNADFNDIANDTWAPIVYISVWIGLTLIFTIIGIVFCVCNKCRCCKVIKSNQLDFLVSTDDDDIRGLGLDDSPSGGKLVWKVIVGILMALWIIGFSFSVFISFASNESLRKSIFELYDDVSNSLDDAQEYIKTTSRQINATFVTSYGNLSDEIRKVASPAVVDLYLFSNDMTKQTNNLMIQSDALLEELEKIENNVNYNESNKVELRGFGNSIRSLQSALKYDIDPFVTKLKNLSKDWEAALKQTGDELEINAYDLTEALNDIPIDDIRHDIENAERDYLDVVGSAVYGSFMGFNLVLLMILIGVVIGSVVIWFGKGQAKKTGFIFYRFSVTMIYIFGWIITLIMVTQFSVFGFMSQIACESVKSMENSTDISNTAFLNNLQLNAILQIDESKYEVPLYGDVVNNCKMNLGAYESLRLDQVYDADSIFNISENFRNFIALHWNNNGYSFFMKNSNAAYSSINKEIVNINFYENVVDNFTTLADTTNLKNLNSKVQYLTYSILKELKILGSDDLLTSQQDTVETIIQLVDHYEQFVYNQVTVEIGRCKPLYHALNSTLHTFCYKVLTPVGTYWWSLQFLLFMTALITIFAHISEQVFV